MATVLAMPKKKKKTYQGKYAYDKVEIHRMIYYEGKTDKEIAEHYGAPIRSYDDYKKNHLNVVSGLDEFLDSRV